MASLLQPNHDSPLSINKEFHMSVNIKTEQELVGQNVPSVVFHTRQGDAWVDVSTDELFKGKTVAVFSLPGAFTPLVLLPTCRVTTNWLKNSMPAA